MSEPVLVVHGVANRDRNAFESEVRNLAARLVSVTTIEKALWPKIWQN